MHTDTARKGRFLMKQNTFVRYLFALLISFSLFSLLLSSDDICEANNFRLNNNKAAAYDIYSYVKALSADKILPDKNTRITQCDNYGKLSHPRCFDYCFKGSFFILFAAEIFYIVLLFIYCEIRSSSKFIIKYIHDQDGHKNKFFVLLK